MSRRRSQWACRLRRRVLGWLVGIVMIPSVHGQSAPTPAATDTFDSAVARERDAETLKALSADGQLLYARERVKLDGYQYCSRAVAAAERGDFRDSVRAASMALYLGQQQGNDDLIAVSKRDLAIAFSYAGDLDRATQYAQEALGLDAKNPAVVAGPAYKTLGDVAVRKGQLPEAIRYYEQAALASSDRFRPLVEISLANAYVAANDATRARAAYDRITPPEGSLLPFYQRSLGNLLLIEGRPEEARNAFELASSSASGSDAVYHRLWAIEGIGRAELALGHEPAATARFVEAAELSDAIRSRFRSEEFKMGLFGDVQDVFERAIDLLARANDQATAWRLSEQSRSRALLDILRERVTLASGTSASAVATARAVTLAEVVAALQGGETLIEFHSLNDRLLVWTIDSKGLRGMQLPIARADLDKAVEAFRGAVFNRRRRPDALASALYLQVIAPLALPAGERLVIVPHGAMHYMPFQALLSDKGFLIETHALAIAPSASIAVQLRRRVSHASDPLVAFGNPANPARDDLPGAQREVQSISRMFAEPRVFYREAASKSRFRAMAGDGRVLHIAAHAEVDSLDPLQSRILLAEEGDDAGVLAAREIYGIDLRGVTLVTLSVCESGLGRVARGDEIVGFTRSFLMAGASGLLVSLWPVADDSTEMLMTTFYEGFAKGRPAIDAMQDAQLAVLHTPKFSHPFFWAPFNLVGDWRLNSGV